MRFLSILLLTVTLLGCESTYYSALESVGVHKRELIVDRVEAASEAQLEASEEFKTALESFKSLTDFEGGELEVVYNNIENQYEASEEAVANVRSRIEAIESVSTALFAEWSQELEQYTNASLRRESERQLTATKASYQKMLDAMLKAEQKMQPVLATLKDNTLFLKHNLNAAAIGSLQNEFASLKVDIDSAIKQMNAAIEESNRFISTMQSK